jgi:hypothetical protein
MRRTASDDDKHLAALRRQSTFPTGFPAKLFATVAIAGTVAPAVPLYITTTFTWHFTAAKMKLASLADWETFKHLSLNENHEPRDIPGNDFFSRQKWRLGAKGCGLPFQAHFTFF